MTLREVYAQRGDYTVKMVIDPSASQSIESVGVDVRNADGNAMEFAAKRWGTKLTISFKVDDSTPDGMSIIDVTVRRRSSTITRERFDFWIVK